MHIVLFSDGQQIIEVVAGAYHSAVLTSKSLWKLFFYCVDLFWKLHLAIVVRRMFTIFFRLFSFFSHLHVRRYVWKLQRVTNWSLWENCNLRYCCWTVSYWVSKNQNESNQNHQLEQRLASWTNFNSKYRAGNLLEVLENTADQVLNFERLASWTNLNSKYRAGNLLEMLENTTDQVLNFSCSDSRAGFLDQSHSIVKWNQSRPGSLLTAQLKIVLNVEKKKGVSWYGFPPLPKVLLQLYCHEVTCCEWR